MPIDMRGTGPCCDPGFPSREHRMHNFYAASRSGIRLYRTILDGKKRKAPLLDKNGGKIIKWEYMNREGEKEETFQPGEIRNPRRAAAL